MSQIKHQKRLLLKAFFSCTIMLCCLSQCSAQAVQDAKEWIKSKINKYGSVGYTPDKPEHGYKAGEGMYYT